MEINLKEEEILSKPVVISVSELRKYNNMMRILINFIHTAILKNIGTTIISDEVSENIKKAISDSIEEFTQLTHLPPSVKTIRRAIDGKRIITIKYIEGETTLHTDDKVEFSIQKVSTNYD